MSDYTPSREMRLAGEKAILTALNQCGISLRYAIAGPSELFDVASVLLKSDWAESIRAEGRAETLADQGKPQITESAERAVLTVDRIAQSTGMTPRDVVDVINSIGKPQITDDRPEVVTLCGSTRFYDEFQEANYRLTMEGKIVLSVGFYPHAKAKHGHGEGVGHDSAQKVALDDLHKRKIDMSDRVLVLNVGGYIGASTRSEIEHARRVGVPVDYLETQPTDSEVGRG